MPPKKRSRETPARGRGGKKRRQASQFEMDRQINQRTEDQRNMASKLTVQDIIMCDMCETSPVQMHCNKCSTNLCAGCVGNHMLDNSKSHNVVMHELRNLDPIFPDCHKHSKQRCELHCRQCDIPLCTTCIASRDHKKHDVTELLEIYNSHKDTLKKKAANLENSVYPSYERNILQLKQKIAELPESYEKVMSAISEQGKDWHREVDIIISRYKEKVQKMKTDDLENLKKILEEMENFLSTLRQTIVDINDLLSSNNVTKIVNEKSLKSDFEDPSSLVDFLPPLFTPSPIKREQLTQMFGTLATSSISRPTTIKKTYNTSNLPEKLHISPPNISTSIDTGIIAGLMNVASVGTDQVWVGGTDRIKRFTLDGSLQETVYTTTGNTAHGITVSQEGDLIYTDGRNININRQGMKGNIISFPQGWTATRICSTATDDLLVSMWKPSTPSRVVRFSGSTEKQIIELDEQGKPIFSSCFYLYIAENNEKDMICVSDQGKQNVLLFNQAGKLCFKYTGNLSSEKYKLFSPRGVAIDSMGNILVADFDNHCIHIIDKNGNFICYIDNCSLSHPFDLSLDRKNMLYVAELSSTRVNLKIIEYLK